MEENAGKQNNKGLLIGVICGAVALVVAIVLIVVFVVKPGSGGLSDDYFKTDDTKYVIEIGSGIGMTDDATVIPDKSYMVYYYSGDTVTGVSSFYEYVDGGRASQAYNEITDEVREGAKEIKLQGKYIEIVLNEENYSGIKPSDIKASIEYMESLKELDFDDDDLLDEDEEDYEIYEDEELDEILEDEGEYEE